MRLHVLWFTLSAWFYVCMQTLLVPFYRVFDFAHQVLLVRAWFILFCGCVFFVRLCFFAFLGVFGYFGASGLAGLLLEFLDGNIA